MEITINLSKVDKSEEIVKPIIFFDGFTIEVMNEEELVAYIGNDENKNEIFQGVDWDSYEFVLPFGNDYYSFKREWTTLGKIKNPNEFECTMCERSWTENDIDRFNPCVCIGCAEDTTIDDFQNLSESEMENV